MMTLNANSKLYRFATMLRSFKAIYRLSPKQVEDFVKAYEIYECDWVNGQAVKDSKSVDYKEVKQSLLNWYGVINHLCAIGVVEKMYIPPTIDPSASVINNQILFEKKFSQWLEMKAGDKVFELGCGRGRVAAHLASSTGAQITGVNIDQGQLDAATRYAQENGLADQCKFMNRDFNDLPFPFPDNYFDCIYEVQVLSLSRDLPKLFQELHRILKPGGKLSLSEWVRLPKYDEHNPHHVELLKQIKPLVGAIGTPSTADYENALREAGFDVLISVDPSVNKSQEMLIDKAGNYYDKVLPFINFLVKIKVLPKHFITLFDRLGKHTEALCEADRLGLVTMSYHFIAQKPKV